MKNWVREQLEESLSVKKAVVEDEALIEALARAAQLCIKAYTGGGKVLVAGNGGSAADAQHIAGELVSRFYYDRPALSAIALTTDTSILTAIGNDYGYERLFARQIEAHGAPNDVFIAISTSGKSPNILAAIDAAKAKGVAVVGLTGKSGGSMRTACDIWLPAPSDSTPRIQEVHITLGHILCAYIERELFPK